MRCSHVKRRMALVLIVVLGMVAPGLAWSAKAAKQTPAPAKQADQFVDGIAAVVGKHVITLSQVNTQAAQAQEQLKRQKIAVPDYPLLQKQVLQRMIAEELERQEAERLGIRVSDAQLDQAVQSVADRNKITLQKLRQEIEKSGISWDTYLKNVRQEVRMDQLRRRAVDSMIVISDADVDAYLKAQSRQGGHSAGPVAGAEQAPVGPAPAQTGPGVLGLAQILIAVPEGSPSSRVQELRKKAEAILARLRGGADFASVAAASSDDPQALKGGDLGVRPTDGWPDLFIQATQNLKAGQVSGIIQSGNGFHILKVLTRAQPSERRGADVPGNTSAASAVQRSAPEAPQGPMMVTQTHVRHILIKVSKVMTDEQARTRLTQLRQRIENGEKFSDMAKRYSQDASAPLGGDLGWLSPGEAVPAFEQAMNALQPGQISEPVQSGFGWHLIQVEERRTKDMADEYKRMQARQILFQRRAEPAFEEWLSQLHGKAYIDNRLDPKSSQKNRR